MPVFKLSFLQSSVSLTRRARQTFSLYGCAVFEILKMRNIGASGTWEAVTCIPICKSRLCEGNKQAFLVCHKSVCHMFR